MYCPSCNCEFRAGFTRCQSCGVDLVADLNEVSAAPEPVKTAPTAADPAVPLVVPMAEYCGFLALQEARQARDSLRQEGIRSEIVIRETPESLAGAPLDEEFWLRVEVAKLKAVQAILGFAAAEESEAGEEATFSCGDCGADVAESESFCPHCGARFDDD